MSDPFWAPDYEKGFSTDHFSQTPTGDLPSLSPGRHRLVVSLLGSSDTPSINPDGSWAFDALGRCTSDVDVRPDTTAIRLVVTFVPDPSSFRATCSIEVAPA